MTTLMLALMMQYVISTKAGLVNHVQGFANVKVTQQVQASTPIQTGSDGAVEVLLTPGSFLRLGPNSEAVLDSVELDKVVVTIVKGRAVIEVVEVDKQYPLTVTSGDLRVEVADAGIYQFADGVATVLEGKLQMPDSKIAYKKGWQVYFERNYRAQKAGEMAATPLDVYSRKRSELIASANTVLAPSLRNTNLQISVPYWLYYPTIGAYTFIPMRGHRSPYGYNYTGVNRETYGRIGTDSDAGAGAASSAAPSSGGGSNVGSSSGGSSGGTRTFSTPAGDSSSGGGYSSGKNAPVRPVP